MLDLGCSPGAWLQIACESLGPRSKGGVVLGIDLTVRVDWSSNVVFAA